MAAYEQTDKLAKSAEKVSDPHTLSIIEQIFYFENLKPEIEADNDNKTSPEKQNGSECFQSWAMPDYLRY